MCFPCCPDSRPPSPELPDHFNETMERALRAIESSKQQTRDNRADDVASARRALQLAQDAHAAAKAEWVALVRRIEKGEEVPTFKLHEAQSNYDKKTRQEVEFWRKQLARYTSTDTTRGRRVL